MIKDDRIILYLDGQLSEKNKLEFENELKENNDLKSQLESYKNFLASINSIKDIELDKIYFSNNIPRFREKLEKKKKFVLLPKLSIVFSTVVAVFLVVFLVLNNRTETSNVSLSNLIKGANQNDIQQVMDSYADNQNLRDALNTSSITDTGTSLVINQSLLNELHLSQDEVEKYLNSQNIDYNNLMSGLGDNEIKTLYNELNSKKYY
jgi:hypothetical protein